MIEGLEVYFGGTFDPPHLGHHAIVKTLLSDSWTARVHLVPTGRNPLKTAQVLGDRARRFAWIETWLKELPRERLVLETLELDREDEGPQYTVDTLRALRERPELAKRPWALCVGSDVLPDLHRWKDAQGLLKELHSVWVIPRGGRFEGDPLADVNSELLDLCEFRLLPERVPDISSTEIRSWFEDERNALQKIREASLLPAIKESLEELVRNGFSK